MKPHARLCLTLTLVGFAACGSVSGFRLAPSAAEPERLAAYQRLVVEDFLHQGAPTRSLAAAYDFPELIAQEVRSRGDFAAVERGGAVDADTLVVRGDVRRWDAGSPALRYLFGFAGMAHFEASVMFYDGGSGVLLGSIDVDRNSWPLGGFFAIRQDPFEFMNDAATRVADELGEARSRR